MQVRKYMTSPALTVSPETDYRSGFDLIRQKHLHHIPVVDGKGRLAGIVAQRDMLLAATHYQNAPVEIAEVMRRKVVSTTPEASVVEAARLMLRRQIGCLPVVDSKHAVIGIITESDLFAVFVRLHSKQKTKTGKKAVKAARKPKKAAKRRSKRI